MKSVTGCVLGAGVMALIGAVCLAAGTLERRIAHAQEQVAAGHYDEALSAFDQAEPYLEYASRVPWIGNGPVNGIRARRAAVQYWRRQYSALAPEQTNPVIAVPADNIDLQLVVADAVYRAGQARANDRQSALQTVDAGIEAYLTVLKNVPRRHERAAYNFEYLVRLRHDIENSRGKLDVSRVEAKGPFGRAGTTPDATSTGEFKILVPLESPERDKNGEAGKAAPLKRKG
jgi:hypothetical protein